MSRLLEALTILLAAAGLFSCSQSPKTDSPAEADAPAVQKAWTVGILTGRSPFDLSVPAGISNPVLTAAAVTDFDADIVAHPFLVVNDSRYYLFCTVKYGPRDEGGIGLAESPDGLHWTYRQMVIKEPFVLSYPYVFKWQDDYYMVPEAHTESAVRLYRATNFPIEWTYEGDLITGDHFISASLAHFQDRWWMFVSPEGNRSLRLFYSPDLKGPWTEHPLSPIVKDNPDIARPGGRVIEIDGTLYRMGQDCDPTYGNQLHAFRITEISPTTYSEEMIEPALVSATSQGWNSDAMHHVDLHQVDDERWIAAVDALGQIP